MRFFDATNQFKNELFLRKQLQKQLTRLLAPVGQTAKVKALYINTSNRAKAEFSINDEPYRCFIDLGTYHISGKPHEPKRNFGEPEKEASIYDIKKMVVVTAENRAKHFKMEYDRAFTA